MAQLVHMLVPWALSTALVVWLLRWDERRLPKPLAERAFPYATFWLAVLNVGPLSLVVHGARTRRSVLGLLGGAAVCAGVVLSSALIGQLLEWALPLGK